MAGGPTRQPKFEGPQTIVTADALNAFVRSAEAGDSFTYCEAPKPKLAEEAWVRARELAQQGLVATLSERRQGGGWRYYVVRTRYKPTPKADPVQAALADPPTDLIHRALKRAANFGQPCQSDADLARLAGLNSRDQAQWRFRKLIDLGLIESQLIYDGGVPSRVVTIVPGPHAGSAGGKSTALPKKWAALQAAAERELRSAGGQG